MTVRNEFSNLWRSWLTDAAMGIRSSLHPDWTFRQRLVRTTLLVLPLAIIVDFFFFDGWSGIATGFVAALPEIAVFSLVLSVIQHFLARKYRERD
jgi:hypothetical protein